MGFPDYDPLWTKYQTEDWFNEIGDYLLIRHPPIVHRLEDTFRYVDLHPKNSITFSYEYSSLLRDIGSVFSSVLDSLLHGVNYKHKSDRQYNIWDFSDFLIHEKESLAMTAAFLNGNYEKNVVLPFRGFMSAQERVSKRSKFKSVWWNAYNSVKHDDITSLSSGCLSNVIYGFCALTFMYTQFHSRVRVIFHRDHIRNFDVAPIFSNIIDGFRVIEPSKYEERIYPIFCE